MWRGIKYFDESMMWNFDNPQPERVQHRCRSGANFCFNILLICVENSSPTPHPFFYSIVSAGGFDEIKFKLTEREYILPKGFGNYTQDSLTTASSCGTIMSTYNGISAYSNGNYQGTGDSCGGSG